MAINNFNKPIGARRQVGATYGERREMQRTSQEQQIQKASRDFFDRKNEASTELFRSNVQYLRGPKVQPHKALETGRPKSPTKITDNMRISFLDKIIAQPAENKPPSKVKTPINSTSKLIKA